MSKATHEFLTLHYFALDSAEWWERILGELLPNAHFPDAAVRRTFAYKMFIAAHIAPSHRRPPHPVWEDSLCLIADLLFGNGMDRYVGAMQGPDSPLEVNVRGFSAGSYSGLAFLHILCPPSLLNMSQAKKGDLLHLIHFESDSLCSWKPGLQQIRDCCTSFTYVTNDEVPGIDLPGGMEALYSLANVPKSWPLARLTIPLSAASKHLERLLEGYCMEVLVRNSNPDSQLHFVRKFAKDLVVVFAFHLAETISALFRHVLDHPSKVLYDPETEPLFLPLFWFYPIYREMLNSASRHRPSKSMELRRAASGLVKVICRTEESRPGGKGLKPGKPKKKGLLSSFGDWFGSINMMNILYVWFPASWGPSVVEAI